MRTIFALALVAICVMPLYGQKTKSVTTGTLNDHDWVDLGLPSGILWATCNVGADSPEDYGDYFAWGEIEPKNTYNWNTYNYCKGNYNNLTKYCDRSSQGYTSFTDTLTILLPEDDVVSVSWGEGWRMPTKEEFEELYKNTTVTWTNQNGVNGRLFIGSNGNHLFLPAAGYLWGDTSDDVGNVGHYWSSSLYLGHPFDAFSLDFGLHYCYADGFGIERYHGHSVRGVSKAHKDNSNNR